MMILRSVQALSYLTGKDNKKENIFKSLRWNYNRFIMSSRNTA
jgi:hypothetical protein